MKLFGIRNCDTMKKARRWLEDNNIAYEFHDYKKDGVDVERLKAQIDRAGLENLVNKRGTTWRKLPEEDKAKLVDGDSAINLLRENASMIKRPVLEVGDDVLVGFNEEIWSERLT
ncbi:ArsC family reductase [Hoeflea sp. TYP-13]|uniref:ArsC family reductase n=1 Tax=Hoeflea sp. TYP-13 TaxID=3230023 RepID=UPI0034C5D419